MPRSTKNQKGGAAGRWNGKGYVYVMKQKKNGRKTYKIGCSRKPKIRLQQIKRTEENDEIKILMTVQAKRMRDAETAAQKAVKKIGLEEDPSRGDATDWFVISSSSPSSEEIITAVRKAVLKYNAKNK